MITYNLLIDWLSFERGEGSFEIGRPRSRRWNNFGRRWTREVGGLKNWTIFMDVICVSSLKVNAIFILQSKFYVRKTSFIILVDNISGSNFNVLLQTCRRIIGCAIEHILFQAWGSGNKNFPAASSSATNFYNFQKLVF